jgi:hypothetical protein
VVGSALAFGVAYVHLSYGEDVLAVAQPVDADQLVGPGAPRVVRLSLAGGGLVRWQPPPKRCA